MIPSGEPRPLSRAAAIRVSVTAACQSPIRTACRRGAGSSATLCIAHALESSGQGEEPDHRGGEATERTDEKKPGLRAEPLVEVVADHQPPDDRGRELEAERSHLDGDL